MFESIPIRIERQNTAAFASFSFPVYQSEAPKLLCFSLIIAAAWYAINADLNAPIKAPLAKTAFLVGVV
ncbi:hypothetical protein ACI7YQ_04605 [Alteromonas marina]|uniref:hypothetical protein n=1 Tax=unclassified Alteromonas TaxID=2614992 RepID=UPI001330F99B|nr:hypothetical protein [Alteromonas sp. KUL150]|tara:strand:- start:928 stop:1134 length:207 start_codon:yes stop_codon:yes gene_type:complete